MVRTFLSLQNDAYILKLLVPWFPHHLLSIYYVPSIVPGPGDTKIRRTRSHEVLSLMEEIGRQPITIQPGNKCYNGGKAPLRSRKWAMQEGQGGHSRKQEWQGQGPGVREGCDQLGNVKRWYLWKDLGRTGSREAEGSLKFLFYRTRNLILEKLSEIATATMNKKEMWFPSYFKKLTREFTLTNAARAVSFDYCGFPPERNV